jgi:abhydrolase domain-containing protein 4
MTIMEEPELIYNYIYHANKFDPSGENGFRAIAEYFGFAKNPMINRVDKVKSHIPIWFIYGSRSWIDYSAGYSAVVQRQTVSEYAQISVKV